MNIFDPNYPDRITNESDLTKLRSGKTLDPKTAEFTISVVFDKEVIIEGVKYPPNVSHAIKINVTANDFANNVNPYFGDRPIGNPGYSEMSLSSGVGDKQTNNPLDVLKVEHRLRYLGFSKFDKTHDNVIKEFKVDTKWDAETALRGFYGATNYINPYYWGIKGQLSYPETDGKDKYHPDATKVVSGNENYKWLNAFNAPHMMNYYRALPVSLDRDVKINKITAGHTAGTRIEAYTTSWILDWIQAWRNTQNQFSSLSAADKAKVLSTGDIRLAGSTSPPGYDPSKNHQHEKGGHSTLMSLDWGLNPYITSFGVNKTGSTQSILKPTERGWSVANAIDWSSRISSSTNPGETRALINFLSLYSLTRDNKTPGVNDGGWEDLTVINGGAVKKAIFGSGDGAAIQSLFLGNLLGDGKNPVPMRTYPRMIEVLNALGIDKVRQSKGGHENHYHIDFKTPTLQSIVNPPGKLEGTQSVTNQQINQLEIEEMSLVHTLVAGVLASSSAGVLADSPNTGVKYKTPYAAGYCQTFIPFQDDVAESTEVREIGVERVAWYYAKTKLKINVGEKLPLPTVFVVETPPSHGKLDVKRPPGDTYDSWAYHPDPGFKGTDKAVFIANMNGELIRIVALLRVEPGSEKWDKVQARCPLYGWVISSQDMKEFDGAAAEKLQAWSKQSALSALISSAANVVTGFAELPGATLGTGVANGAGETILLDTGAAGHGWTDRRFNRMRPSIAPRKRHQAG